MQTLTNSPICGEKRRCLPVIGVTLGEAIPVAGAILAIVVATGVKVVVTAAVLVSTVVTRVVLVCMKSGGLATTTSDPFSLIVVSGACCEPSDPPNSCVVVESFWLTSSVDEAGNGMGAIRAVDVHFVFMMNFIVMDFPEAVESASTIGVARGSTSTTHPAGLGTLTSVEETGCRGGRNGTVDKSASTTGPAAIV